MEGNVDVQRIEKEKTMRESKRQKEEMETRLSEVESKGRSYLQEVIGLKRRISNLHNVILKLEKELYPE